jgi:adenylate kinase family enzyme
VELQTIIFYGKAGSGKGTQAELLRAYLEKNDTEHSATHFETGAQLRTFAKQNNFTAQRVRQSLAEGKLVPEFLPVWVWTTFFMHHLTGNEHLLLDGLARRAEEVPILFQALQFYERKNIKVVVLTISTEEALARLKIRARADDAEEEIRRRLAWYDENVVPAISIWESTPGIEVLEIFGERPIEDVHRDIVQSLKLS